MVLELKWRGTAWYVMGTIVDPSGEKIRIRKSTGFGKADKVYAEAQRQKIMQEVLAGKWGLSGVAETLQDVIDLFTNRPRPPGATDMNILRRLGEAMGERKVASLKGVEIMAWVTSRGNKPGTVAREIACISACLGYARQLGVEVGDVRLVKPVVDDARERWLTRKEIEEFLEACPEESRDEARFLFGTGARLGEMFSLVKEDLELVGERPYVVLRTRKGKGGKVRKRMVPLRADLVEVLKGRVNALEKNGIVFPGPGGKGWDRTNFYRYWSLACDLSGVEDFRPHDCRHTFASLLVQAGVRERVVAQLLGHTTLNLVMRYSHLAPDHLDEAVSALDRAGAGASGYAMAQG